MTKYTEELDLLRNVLGHIRKIYKGTSGWKVKNLLEFKNSKKESEGTIAIDNLSIDIKGKKLNDMYKKYKKEYLELTKQTLKTEDLDNTPLKEITSNRSRYGGIETRPVIAKKLLAEFKKIGIKHIKVTGNVPQTETIKNELNLKISVNPDGCGTALEEGYYGRLKTHLFDTGYTDVERKEDIDIPDTASFILLEKEQIVPLKENGTLLGHYYPERNMVTLYFNPFSLTKTGVFDTEIPEIWKSIFLIFRRNKVTTNNIDNIQEKIFVSEFLKNSRNKLTDVEHQQKDITTNITSHERGIRDLFKNYNENEAQLNFLQQTIENGGEGLFKEVKKVKDLSFIEKVKIEGGQIDLKFKPTFIPIPDMMRSEHGKTYGKRFIWVGSIGFRITADDFRVYGDVNINERCHPHGSSYPEGNPCFGEGEGSEKIYGLLAGNKFISLAKMLWFWIKTYRNSGAYVKVWAGYDSLLQQGYPIIDEKGKRVVINDPVRLKSGEQVKLTKESNYESNLKKFAKIKMEG